MHLVLRHRIRCVSSAQVAWPRDIMEAKTPSASSRSEASSYYLGDSITTVCRQSLLHFSFASRRNRRLGVAVCSGTMNRESDTVYIGHRNVRGGQEPFGLCRADRRHHMYCLGKTGSGKTTLLRNLILQDIEAGEGVGVIDPIAPIQNKVGQLLMAPPIRNIFGQIKTKIDPAFMMNNRRIFIANLSKGKLGPDKASLIGAVLVTQFQLAAMARAGILENERRDFYFYIDELHNFSTDSFASLLSESRKYRLCLTLSHQYSTQLREEVRDAVFGNVGTLVSFRVGENDGHVLQREFGNEYAASHFTELANFEVCVKML